MTMLQDLKSHLGVSIHSVQRFLQRPINMVEGNITLGVSESSLREQALDAERKRVRRMKHDLYLLLEQHPSSRQLMRRLDAVEHMLCRGGFDAVEALPVRIIAKALAELERLVRDWSPVGLAELRSRLSILVKSRADEVRRDAETTAAMELDQAQPADVSEGLHSDFDELERSWTGHMPLA